MVIRLELQSAVAPPYPGSAHPGASAADGPSASSASVAAAHDLLAEADLDVAVAHMERRGALVPPKMDIDDDPGGKRVRVRIQLRDSYVVAQ